MYDEILLLSYAISRNVNLIYCEEATEASDRLTYTSAQSAQSHPRDKSDIYTPLTRQFYLSARDLSPES